MLHPSEKAFCLALMALKSRQYSTALTHFSEAEPYFSDNREFALFQETTRLLCTVKAELMRQSNADSVLKEN